MSKINVLINKKGLELANFSVTVQGNNQNEINFSMMQALKTIDSVIFRFVVPRMKGYGISFSFEEFSVEDVFRLLTFHEWLENDNSIQVFGRNEFVKQLFDYLERGR